MVKTADFCVFWHFSVPQDPPQGAKFFSKKKIFFHLKIAMDVESTSRTFFKKKKVKNIHVGTYVKRAKIIKKRAK